MPRRNGGRQGYRSIAAARNAAEALKSEVYRRDQLTQRRYIREFDAEYSSWENVASWDELLLDCWRADLIYVGDYHALPQSQAFAARLLSELSHRSPNLMLAVEVVRTQHQAALDLWLSGQITEREFHRQTHYDRDWGYPWEGFRDLIGTAQEHGIPVAAIDCDPRRGLRFIRKRDQTIAARLTGILQEDPTRQILVHIGESHLASEHLPARVSESLHSVGMQARDLVIVQNSDEIYWDLLQQGVPDPGIVRVSERRYCATTATPLEKYEAYRQVQERWLADDAEDELDMQPVVFGIVDSILGFLGVDKYTWCVSEEGIFLQFVVDVYPEVYGPHRVAEIGQILAGLPLSRIEEIRSIIRNRGCRYVPEINAVFMSRFEVPGAAEEAAHFVHAALSGRANTPPVHTSDRFARLLQDSLWEARGWFGSKIVHPGRSLSQENPVLPTPDPNPRGGSGLTREQSSDLAYLLPLIEFLREPDPDADVPSSLKRRLPRTVEAIRRRARVLGFWLGERMWTAFGTNRLEKDEILELFRDPLFTAHAANTRLERLLDTLDRAG